MTTASRPALQQRSMSLSRFVIYGLLILFAAIFLIPVYMVLMTGFKNPAEVSISTMWQFPSSFSLESYGQALQVLAPGLTNSFLLVIPGDDPLVGARVAQRLRLEQVALPPAQTSCSRSCCSACSSRIKRS